MRRDKKITDFARKLAELSKEDGIVTDARVREVLKGLQQAKPPRYGAILKAYLRLIRREVASQTAVVSTPADLSEDALKAIEANFAQLYGRKIQAVTRPDPSLIAGVRVRVGDDVYDASVAGRLKRLAEAVR